MTEETNTTEPQVVEIKKHKAPIGPVIGIIIILVVILIGGLSYLSSKLRQNRLPVIQETLRP